MAAQAPDLLPGFGVPDIDFPVGMHGDEAADCGQAAPVGAEGHRLQKSIVVAADESTGVRVPQCERIVIDRGKSLTVGTELYSVDLGGEFQRELVSTSIHVPDLH